MTEIPDWIASTLASDASKGQGALPFWIRALTPETTVAGPALVVEVATDDNQPMRDVSAAVTSPGTVLVVTGAAQSRTAILGDLVARELLAAGVVAVVTDGLIRDSRDVAALGLAVWARGTTPIASAKNGPGSVGGSVTIAGVTVADGDVVVADADGVVVWPADSVEAMIAAADAKRAADDERLAQLEPLRLVSGMVLSRYSEVLRHPHVSRLLLTAVMARLPQGMSGLAIILFLTPHLGYGRAGVATGVSVAGAGISNVLLARAVDRIGARRVLAPAATLYAAAMIGLSLSSNHQYGVQLVVCGVIGLVTPPISSVSRGLWPRLLGEANAQVVYGLEATAQELVFIAGPAIVALVAGLSSPRAALISSGALGLIGALAYVSAPPFATTPEKGAGAGRQQALRGTRVLRYAIVGACLTLGFSMTDISTVAFAGGSQASAKAGVVLAIWSAGSLAGGLLFGASKNEVTDGTLTKVLLIASLGVSLAALAPNSAGLAAILFVSGAAVAPLLARLYTRMGAVSSDATRTEAFGWLALGFLIGSSAGAALGGLSVDAIGARWTFLLAGVGALCSVPVITLGRPVASSHGR